MTDESNLSIYDVVLARLAIILILALLVSLLVTTIVTLVRLDVVAGQQAANLKAAEIVRDAILKQQEQGK